MYPVSEGNPFDCAIVDGPVRAIVSVPGSKSLSNRALICAALADGESRIENLASGEDTRGMIEGLGSLHVALQEHGDAIEVHGLGGRVVGDAVVDAGLAGTTSRFLTAVAALGSEPTTITGGEPLRRRPMGDLHSALRSLGADVRSLEDADRLPVLVRRASLTGGSIGLRGDVSSQFLSALMLIAPYLPGGLRIELTSPLISKPYVDMSANVMASFGHSGVEITSERVIVAEGEYKGCLYSVEPDASSASYPLAAAAIARGSVEVEALTRRSIQGDVRILDLLEAMGCNVEATEDSCVVSRVGDLSGIDVDMSDVSDLVPTIAVVALFASSPTRIRNVGFIRAKESDRIGDLVAGITELGGMAFEHADGLEVFPLQSAPSFPIELSSHHDHRLAIVWSLVALLRPGIRIDDPGVVNKSWPEWWQVRELIRRSSIH